MAQGDRLVGEGLRFTRVGREHARHPVRLRDDVGKDAEASLERLVDQVGAVDVEDVEEAHTELAVGVGLVAREQTHGLLEGADPILTHGRAVDLAVEDHRVDRHAAHDVDHTREPGSDIVEVAGEQPHVIAQAVSSQRLAVPRVCFREKPRFIILDVIAEFRVLS